MKIVHRYAAPFRAACGAHGSITTHVDIAKVTCPTCLNAPADPAAIAEFDQLSALIKDATETEA